VSDILSFVQVEIVVIKISLIKISLITLLKTVATWQVVSVGFKLLPLWLERGRYNIIPPALRFNEVKFDR